MNLFRRQTNIAALFRDHGEEIAKYIASNALRPPGFGGMTHAFSGTDGKQYYTWQDHSEMPPCRQQQAERCFKMADAGIGEKTLNELVGLAETANMDGLRAMKNDERSKHASRVAYLLGELKNRPKNIIPEEVFYDFVAIMAIREDEDPRTFDTVIHGQKIDMLRGAAIKGLEFFTKLPILRKYWHFSLTTEQRFIELLSVWAAQANRMEGIRRQFGS